MELIDLEFSFYSNLLVLSDVLLALGYKTINFLAIVSWIVNPNPNPAHFLFAAPPLHALLGPDWTILFQGGGLYRVIRWKPRTPCCGASYICLEL